MNTSASQLPMNLTMVDTRQVANGGPPPLPEEIHGLRSVKHYLLETGFLRPSGNSSFDDYIDNETVSALRDYQKFFKLAATGKLDKDTLHLMSLPRCRIGDVNIDYDLSDGISWPLGKQWYGTRRRLTYGFKRLYPSNELAMPFRVSFQRWLDAIKNEIRFKEDVFYTADIQIYSTHSNTTGTPVAGTVILAEGDSVWAHILVQKSYSWVSPDNPRRLSLLQEDGNIDLESVAMHQIGHLLGLPHSSDIDSIMYPYMLPEPKVEFSSADREQIRKLYSSP